MLFGKLYNIIMVKLPLGLQTGPISRKLSKIEKIDVFVKESEV